MSTTEVVVEQVLTGALVLLIVAASFDSTQWHVVADLVRSPTISVALIGLAYLLGVPFDRFADSILQDLEDRARLRFAWDRLEKQPVSSPLDDVDPFHESLLRVKLQQKGAEAPREHMEYLRTRMRIARALAVYVPGITASLILGPIEGFPPAVTLIAVGVAYFLLFAIAVLPSEWFDSDDRVTTERLAQRVAKAVRERPHADEQMVKHVVDRTELRDWLDLTQSRILRIVVIAAVVSLCVILLTPHRADALPVFAAGCFLAGVSGWSWVRITRTFYRLLVDFEETVGGQST